MEAIFNKFAREPHALDVFMHEPLHKVWESNDCKNVPQGSVPYANIVENEEDFILEVSLAGFKRSDVNLKVCDGILTINAVSGRNQTSSSNFRRREFSNGPFGRSFVLPSCVDIEAIEAVCKDGLLSVRLPKKEVELAEALQIDIH